MSVNILHLFTIENIILFFVLVFICYYIYTWFKYKEFFGKMKKKKHIFAKGIHAERINKMKVAKVHRAKQVSSTAKFVIKNPINKGIIPILKPIKIPPTKNTNIVTKSITNVNTTLGNITSKIEESQNNISNLTDSLNSTREKINKLSEREIFKVDMSSSTDLIDNLSTLDKNIASNAAEYIKNINDKKKLLFTGI